MKRSSPVTFRPKLSPKMLKIFVNLYQLGYCAAMILIYIFPNCNQDTSDYDVIDPENSTKLRYCSTLIRLRNGSEFSN